MNEKFNFRAQSPGMTRSATTRMVPITFMDKTIVMAISRSKITFSCLVGMPSIRESSSSKTIDKSSLRKKLINTKTKALRTEGK